MLRRAPYGARGLKHRINAVTAGMSTSRPVRGAWIETSQFASSAATERSRPVRGAWIETCTTLSAAPLSRRAPYGARGLKHLAAADRSQPLSRPVRGAWIETPLSPCVHHRCASRPVRGAWIETSQQASCAYSQSRPVRGAWIETHANSALSRRSRRAPYGARGLKPMPTCDQCCDPCGRAPYGARGLKHELSGG